MIVAIDGPSGVGKSTVARRLAGRLGVPYLETGAMYRALGLEVLERGLDPQDRHAVEALARNLDLELELTAEGGVAVVLNGERPGNRLRAPEISEATSRISVYPAVRIEMVRRQRSFAGEAGAVLEGRDIGTKVFPDTPFKFFLTAPAEVRIERRLRQLQAAGRTEVSAAEVSAEVADRDHRDTHREASPLTFDASYERVDSADMSVDEVVRFMERRILER